jgi:DNA repair exonuclease SbcCD nuclease subunit
LRKLVEVGEIATRVKARAILDGGDFFDIKSPTRNSHSLVRRVIELHRDYPCPVFANVGNHDCVYGDYSYLHQQPLGVLFGAGAFQRCYDEHEAIFVFGSSVSVRVVGVPYHGTVYDLERFRRIQKGSEDYLVCIAHCLASPSGGTLFDAEDVIRYGALDEFAPDVFCFGHWHKDQGVSTTPGGKHVVNTGSMTRGSLVQDDLDRIPSVVHLKFAESGFSAEKIALTHTPSNVVFDLEARDMRIMRKDMIEEFVGNIQSILKSGTDRSVRDTIRDLPNVPNEVKERAILYVERAGG